MYVAIDPSIPDDLIDRIQWLEAVSMHPVDVNDIVCQIALRIEHAYEALKSGRVIHLLNQWRSRSATLGEHVVATTGNRTISGIARDITSRGALLIEDAHGCRHELDAGEISIRRADGSYT